MKTDIKRRLKKLEVQAGGGMEDTFASLCLIHRLTHGGCSPEDMERLKQEAQRIVARGETMNLKELLREVDGKGLPRPGEHRGGNHEY
ncbi:MAG: hypothetical protein P8X58_09335 [Syntrophobacterales bacterium]